LKVAGFLAAGLLSAASPLGAPLITNFPAEVYRSDDQTWAVIQDRRGVLYFGCTAGLLEYDGLAWRVLQAPGRSAVIALGEGPDGRIYYGSNSDFGYLEVTATGQTRCHSLRPLIPGTDQVVFDVLQVESCADGLYFLTRDRFFRYQGGRVTVVPAKLAPSQPCVLDNTLVYSDADKGLCMVEGDQVFPLPGLAGLAEGKRVALAPLGPHAFLMARLSGDFRRIDLGPLWNEAAHRFDPARPAKGLATPFPTEIDAAIREGSGGLNGLRPLANGAFAVLTIRAGVLLIDRQGRFIQAVEKSGGLADNLTTGLLQDPSGNLWVTTAAGIAHVELGVPQTVFLQADGIQGTALTVGSHGGRLYVSTYQDLFVDEPFRFAYGHPRARFSRVPEGPRSVWQFLDSGGDYLAAASNGLFRIRQDRAERIPGTASRVYLCMETSPRWPGLLFVGRIGGVEIFRRSGGTWVSMGELEGVRENIRHISAEAGGDLWLSTEAQGLLRVHFTGASPRETLSTRFGVEQGLPALSDLHATALGGTIYVTTSQGLLSAPSGGSGSFTPDQVLGRILPDPREPLVEMVSDGAQGYHFITAHGVEHAVPLPGGGFRLDSLRFRGLPAPSWRLHVDEGGVVWLPGKVLHRVDPGLPWNPGRNFPVLIRQVATQSSRTLDEGGGLAPAPLPFRENGLTFSYGAAFFEKPGSTRYQVLLEGFDPHWGDWTASTTKEYTNLPEGSYRFRVRARNLLGVMGQEASYAFRILPPWYRTLPATFAGLILSAGLLALGLHLYTRRLKRQKQRLEALVAQRTAELRAVNERLYHLNDEKNRIIGVAAHDLRNPLSGILMGCDDLDESPAGEHAEVTRTIRRQGRLMDDLIQGLLDVNAIEAGTAEVPNVRSFDPESSLSTALRTHQARAQQKGIALEPPAFPCLPVQGDERHFQRVMDNLLSNAVKYSPRDTRVRITVTEEPAASIFRVADQGPGLTPEDRQRLFQTYARLIARPTAGESSVGLGLSIVKKLVDGMGGQVWAEGEPGTGAVFCVKLARG
jgi:signal transduction histidine kinase